MESQLRPGRRFRGAGLAVMLVTGFTLASCGGSGGSDAGSEASVGTSTTTPATTVSPTVVDGSAAGDAPESSTAGTESSPTTVHEVTADTVEVRDPIGLEDTGDFGTGVTATVLDLRAVDGEARIPGEIAGPALRAEVRLTNDTGEAIDLAGARIDVVYGADRTPGLIVGQPDVVSFPASIEPGGEATAASVFVVPLDQRDVVRVVVWYATDAPIMVFEGTAPTE